MGPPGPAGPPGSGGPFTARLAVHSPENGWIWWDTCYEQSLFLSNAELSENKSVEISWEAPDTHAWIKGLSHSFILSTSPGLPPTLQINYEICTRLYRHSRLISLFIIVGQ